jgi:hypothetical protein
VVFFLLSATPYFVRADPNALLLYASALVAAVVSAADPVSAAGHVLRP